MDKDIFKNMQKIFTNISEEETFICSNCKEEVPEEEMGESELALKDCVCKECMQDYGK